MSSLSPEQMRALSALIDALAGARIVIIGAAALGFRIEMTWRSTNDIDLAVATDIATAATRLRAHGFKQHPRFEHRWFSDRVALDVLPVTDDDIRLGRLTWPVSAHVMSLEAFDLVFEHAEQHTLDSGHTVEVASPATVVLLKMAAWLDRPDERARDLEDFRAMLSEYLGAVDDRRWDDERLAVTPHDQQSAFALGLDVLAVAKPHHRELAARFMTRLDRSAFALEKVAPIHTPAQLRLDAFRRALSI